MGSPVVFSCDQSLHSRPAFLQTMISRSFSEDNRRWYVEHLFVTENNKSWMVLKQPCLKNNRNSTKKFRSHLKPDFNLVFFFSTENMAFHSGSLWFFRTVKWGSFICYSVCLLSRSLHLPLLLLVSLYNGPLVCQLVHGYWSMLHSGANPSL